MDPRRNLNGRPRTFDQARALAQEIAHEELTLKDGRKVPVVEAVLRSLAKGDTRAKEIFLQYAFGKVPDELKATGLENKPVLVLHYAHERSDPSKN